MERKKVSNWYTLKNQAGVAELFIYGYIGPWEEVDFVSFRTALKGLSDGGNNQVTLRIHSGGGSVIDGLAIYDALKASGLSVTVCVDGMAASMASVLVQAADQGKRRMSENGTMMIHRVQGSEYGNADELRAYADLVENLEARIQQIFIRTSGQSEKTVKSWFERNTDFWIDAQQALVLGLVDEIVADERDKRATDQLYNKTMPLNKLRKLGEQKAYELLSNNLHDKKQSIDMNKLQILIMAALAARGVTVVDNATEEQTANAVVAALKTADDKILELQNQLKAKDSERADALVNSLVAAGKLKNEDEDGKKEIKELAIVNYGMAVKLGDKLIGKSEPPKNVTVNVTTTGGNTSTDDRQDWTLNDYQTKDPEALKAMQDEDPERFDQLVAALRNNLKQKGAIA